MTDKQQKPICWVGSSKKDLLGIAELSPEIGKRFGRALSFAQFGTRHPHAKPLSGFGSAGILEQAFLRWLRTSMAAPIAQFIQSTLRNVFTFSMYSRKSRGMAGKHLKQTWQW